jgi:MOSC domain-containing protein YiiM
MRVVSVNVSPVRTIAMSDGEVPTGIFKEPVEGRVTVRRLGLDGDAQADLTVHGGVDQAVYAYALEDVEWWEGELRRPLGPGFFGENLTLHGVQVNEARPGEIWEVGDTLLQVTKPRQPCRKLATKVGDLGFVKRFVLARRPGAYLRVLREGTVATGDRVTRFDAAEPAPTVRELAPG